MKKFVVLALISVFAISCEQNDDYNFACEFEEINQILTITRPMYMENTRSGETDSLLFVAKYKVDEDKVIDFKVQAVTNGIAEDMDMATEEIRLTLIERLGENFTDLETLEQAETQATMDLGLADCLAKCRKDYTDENGKKMKGRGMCKFECWTEAVIKVLKELAEPIQKLILKK